MNVKIEDLCTFCNEERETIEHLFTECEFSLIFFNRLKILLLEKGIVEDDFVLNAKFILFGTTPVKKYQINKQLQYVFLVAKYFIYKCRCEEILPVFTSFLKYYANKYETIRYIAIKNLCIEKFDQDWKDYNL